MRQTRYVLIDDIDGSDAVATVNFSVGSKHYEIDLSSENLEQFDTDMAAWTKYARHVRSGSRQRSSSSAPGQSQLVSDAPLIRMWAKHRGIDVAPRGRIPAALRQQYYAESVGEAGMSNTTDFT